MAETLVNKNQAGEGIWTSDNLVAGSGISIQQVQQPVIDSNTTNLFHLNESLEDVITSTTPTVSGTVSYLDGKFGKGLQYTGSSSIYHLHSWMDPTATSFTFDFWLAPSSSSASSVSVYIDTKNYAADSWLSFTKSSNISLASYISGTGSTATVPTPQSLVSNWGSWFHVAYVNDLSHSKVYLFVDGAKVYEANKTETSNKGLRVALYGSSTMRIDECRISNIARWTSNFTPYTVPYSASAGPAQYAINNTKADPDLSSYLQNTATGYSTSLTILGTPTTADSATNIGDGSNALQGSTCLGTSASANNSATFATCVGTIATASATHGVALGRYARVSGNYGIAIGGAPSSYRTSVSNTDGIAIGHTASSTAQSAIQLGTGTNSTANTFQVFNTTVVNASGKIPMSSTDVTSLTGYDATKTQVLKNVNGTLTWVDEA